jgi:hypothetical protein
MQDYFNPSNDFESERSIMTPTALHFLKTINSIELSTQIFTVAATGF